ncbi:MAG: dicarboxylate/amino acid:cation symporter [Gemmataceae bacterium]|nr:dicarboxylate/amino acid:cation symporter [Gemmataceae bacterium]
MADARAKESNLHRNILIGLILGAVLGVVANRVVADSPDGREVLAWALRNVVDPIGEIFRRLLVLVVVPLVFASLSLGVARLGDLSQLGRIGAKTFGYFLVTTTFAVVIGLALVQWISPGTQLSPETRQGLEQQFRGAATERLSRPAEFGISTFVNIVPDNPLRAAVEMQMLPVIFVALLVGIGLTRIDPAKSRSVQQVLEGIGELTLFIIHLAMRVAPVGVFALIFSTSAKFGFELLQSLGLYVATVLLGLSIQMFGVFPILLTVLGRMNPWLFFRRIRTVILTAFSTSSSSATLSTSMAVAQEELKIPKPLAGFVLPLGATMNMNGTALFEGVTVLFLCQIFGRSLAFDEQIIVVLMSVLIAIGAAGVPGGSIPLLGMVLATVGIEPGAIAIILGVDRLLDMCRTTVNVTGDLTAAVYVARSEADRPAQPEMDAA